MSDLDTTEDITSQNDAETTENNLDTEEQSDDVEALRASNKKLFERTKAAEDKLRALKKERYDAQVNAQDKNKLETNADVSDREELKAIARGMSDEEIDEAKSIAKGKDITLTEAFKTKSFLAFQRELKEETKKEDAKLGATRGSTQSKKDSFRAGMTSDEHKALWKEKYGN
jgi:hypothetical protein